MINEPRPGNGRTSLAYSLFERLREDSQLRERLGISFILLAALALRLYRTTTLPGGISGDELFNAIDAWRVGQEHWPIFFEGNNGREALFLYTMAASLRLLGQTILAIRLPAVLYGLGSVLLAWGIGRNFFNSRTGLLAAGLMAVSLWPVMESRWGLRAVSLTFWTALTLYLLDLGFRRRERRYWLLGGISLGLTMYTYIPSRAFPAVVVVWLGWLFWVKRHEFKAQWASIALSLLMALIVFAPFGLYMVRNPDKVNQRVNTLTTALDRSRQTGSVGPLVESTTGVLGMFSLEGDEDWRYHVSGVPVFDPVTSFFFYAGLIICLWRAFSATSGGADRPSYALLPFWVGAMLSPLVILDVSFLRAAGAIVPVYLTVAVGFDVAATWLANRWPRLVRPIVVMAVVFIGLSLTAFGTWQRYSTVWNNEDEVRNIYQVYLAAIGEFLNDNPAPDGTRVFIGGTYVADLAPKTFDYYSDQPVDWFDARNSFALGRVGQEESVWVLNALDTPLQPHFVEKLSKETEITVHTFPDGDPAFIRYEFQPDDLLWQPSYSELIDFQDGPLLVGYDAADELFRGETTPIILYFKVPPERTGLPNSLTFAQVSLEDQQGNVWAKSDTLMGYPEASWHAEDRFLVAVPLTIPEGMPPGPAALRFDLHDSSGQLRTIMGATAGDNTVNLSRPLFVRSRALTDYQPAADVPVFAGEMALENEAFSTLFTPGMAVDVRLDWVALQQPSANYQVQLQLLEPESGVSLLSQTDEIWPDVYPPVQWQAGEQVSSFHRLVIPLDFPTASSPELHVRLLFEDESLPLTQGSTKVADMTLDLRERDFEIPDLDLPTDAQFGDDIRLLGYELDASGARPGGSVFLTLVWQAINTPADNYTVFNHIRLADGDMQGQFDSPPVGDAWLTETWLPGEVVVEVREIPIRAEAVPGRYPLFVGLYTPSDGVRLPVRVNGQQVGDQMMLTEIEITQ